jgi:hypothetical protein
MAIVLALLAVVGSSSRRPVSGGSAVPTFAAWPLLVLVGTVRKIWRAILRSDLAVFDTSGGNPNVAFELGLAVAESKRCMTMVKEGEPDPLGRADLGYAERASYSSRETLKTTLLELASRQSTGLRLLHELSYELQGAAGEMERSAFEDTIRAMVLKVFNDKHITKRQAASIMGADALATTVLNALREKDVLQVQGQRRGARWGLHGSVGLP